MHSLLRPGLPGVHGNDKAVRAIPLLRVQPGLGSTPRADPQPAASLPRAPTSSTSSTSASASARPDRGFT